VTFNTAVNEPMRWRIRTAGRLTTYTVTKPQPTCYTETSEGARGAPTLGVAVVPRCSGLSTQQVVILTASSPRANSQRFSHRLYFPSRFSTTNRAQHCNRVSADDKNACRAPRSAANGLSTNPEPITLNKKN